MYEFDLKEEALDPTKWRSHFGRGFGPVVRQAAKWMDINLESTRPRRGPRNRWQDGNERGWKNSWWRKQWQGKSI
jgi:hypothetical protein